MNENNRLKELQSFLKFRNQSEFAAALGIKQGSLSDIYRGKSGIGVSDSIKRILDKEFSINIDWLETGEGDMVTNEQKSENNSGLGIIGNNVNGGSINDHKVVLEMVELLRKKDEQIDRLIGIIEKIK